MAARKGWKLVAHTPKPKAKPRTVVVVKRSALHVDPSLPRGGRVVKQTGTKKSKYGPRKAMHKLNDWDSSKLQPRQRAASSWEGWSSKERKKR